MTLLLIITMSLSQLSVNQLNERLAYLDLAKVDLIQFARLTMPVAADRQNPRLSRYQPAEHHSYIGGRLEKLARGQIKRLMLQVPYRHGKTELAVRRFVPWLLGLYPEKSGIVVTHTDSLANEHGRDVRNCMLSEPYKQIFTRRDCQLREDSKAMDRLQVYGGGAVQFTGRSGLGAGFGADWIIFDDFFKNSEEARSKAVREHAWETYISDCKTRLNDANGWVLIIGTRRHEDDVQGRLIDPANQHYDEREAQRWTVIRLPALAEVDDPMNRRIDEPLWPERFPFAFWDEMRQHKSPLVRADFQTQAQCNPSPESGTYFLAEWLCEYQREDLPKHLRRYAASDHAVSTRQEADFTCMGAVGICPAGDVWVLDELFWEQKPTDVVIEAMLGIMRRQQPVTWWAESGHITKSVGPFLRRRMIEEKVFCAVDEVVPVVDKQQRAQSIRGRMAMRKVHFPAFAAWWPKAKQQLLKFPNDAHDDFVDMLAHVGMGLDRLVGAETPEPWDKRAKPGTLAWVKENHEQAQAAKRKGIIAGY